MTDDPVEAADAAGQPNCYRCAAFFITHDAAFPYGCRAMGFRSRRFPCLEVLATSGEVCRSYIPKPGTQR